jgi:alkanesulfonate monooxygenase
VEKGVISTPRLHTISDRAAQFSGGAKSSIRGSKSSNGLPENNMAIELRGRLGHGRPITDGFRPLSAGDVPPRQGLDPRYITSLSQQYEREGFDGILVAQRGYSAEVWSLSAWALAATQRIKLTASHRPGLQLPTHAARTFATLDQLSGGRIAVHIIQGFTNTEQQREGDFLDKDERYRRSAEYLEIFNLELSSDEPFDYQGEFYTVKGAYSEIKPVQRPRPFISTAGASGAGIELAARYTDGYAFFPEPIRETTELLARIRARASAYGRSLKYWRDANFILAETDDQARAKAEGQLKWFRERFGHSPSPVLGATESVGQQRLHELASKGDWHDRALFTGLWKYNAGGPPFVGSPETAAAAVLDYYDLGIDIFSIGFHGDPDPQPQLQAELLQRIRLGAAERDRRRKHARIAAAA